MFWGIFVAHYQEANRQSTKKTQHPPIVVIYTIPPDDGLLISPIHVEVDMWK